MTARRNIVASVLARLRNLAAGSEQSFNDILQAYVIERFLARLARSPQADTVLLKGALMLRVWGVPRARPTMDIDFLRRGIADQAVLVQFVEQCAAIEDPSDGVIFEPSTISVDSIRDTTEYVGTRIRIQARLANVRQTVQIDFGVGDAVHPQPQIVEYPVLLTNSPIRLHAYPVEATIAEKFHAMVDLDLQNSRMKDFYDIWILSRTMAFSGHGLSEAIRYTFQRRQTSVPTAAPVAWCSPIFVVAAAVYVLALLLLHALSPRFRPVASGASVVVLYELPPYFPTPWIGETVYPDASFLIHRAVHRSAATGWMQHARRWRPGRPVAHS